MTTHGVEPLFGGATGPALGDPTVIGALVGAVVGLCVGAAAVLFIEGRRSARLGVEAKLAQGRLLDAQTAQKDLASQLQQVTDAFNQLTRDHARTRADLEHLAAREAERKVQREEDREGLLGAFAQLSTDALRTNAEQFLTLADARLKEASQVASGDLGRRQDAIAQLLVPLRDVLSRYESGLREMELDRKGAYSGLNEQVKQLAGAQEQLKKETHNLVSALKAPQTRGRWGEMQLRRVVEMAGMLAHCDFEEQVTKTGDEGRVRPDLVVHLPGGAQVVVDAKVPLDAYLKAVESEDEAERKGHLVAHARQLRAHIDQLSQREYWRQFDPSPDFVVAFVPGDPLLEAAFQHDGELIEHAIAKRVLITTPTTLIALLSTFARGWRDEALAENARLVRELGTEIYERLRVMSGHFAKMHRSLTTTVESFNDVVGSLESRVLVTARRFSDLSVVAHDAKDIVELYPVTSTPRVLQATELSQGATGTTAGHRPILVQRTAPDELPGVSEGS
ncbi:MAG: DNA recombination protein RmuC [Acidimicrobiales bacterium]